MMADAQFMRMALRLAGRGYGRTSPNPMVGAVLVQRGRVIGRGWHRMAGGPHAEIEALRDAQKRGEKTRSATIYVTLEPCSTQGRTPPCTEALIAAGIKRVVVGTVDPNPKHAGKGFKILERAKIKVDSMEGKRHLSPTFSLPRLRDEEGDRSVRLPDGQKNGGRAGFDKIADECAELNAAFNHWIVRGTPWVRVKAAMTMDGKIATASGESKWITGEAARAYGMKLRLGSDAILVGVNTILADDPSLTVRTRPAKAIRRIVLDSQARTPVTAKVVTDEQAAWTTIVVGKDAPKQRVAALAKRVKVLVAPYAKMSRQDAVKKIDLRWLLKRLGAEQVTALLVEGGGEVNASFLLGGLAQQVAFFYAPKILGGRDSRKAVGGEGVKSLSEVIELREIRWRRLGEDLLMEATIKAKG
jgi:diaminohydroxyphosphoribosylaminopyrimidine deaminase/5-amino-6-(5-phosphoribosylamino)uracil reductase